MNKLKKMGMSFGLMLFILSLATAYMSWTKGSAVRPADSYEDRGIHPFAPYRLLPIQVENTSGSSRSRRMNPTKTVYVVYYRTTDGTGYRWKREVASKSQGQKILAEKELFERRVLAIRGEKKYISVDAELTAESYTTDLKQKYTWALAFSVVYILAYITVWGVIFWKRRQTKEWSTLNLDNPPSWVKKKP